MVYLTKLLQESTILNFHLKSLVLIIYFRELFNWNKNNFYILGFGGFQLFSLTVEKTLNLNSKNPNTTLKSSIPSTSTAVINKNLTSVIQLLMQSQSRTKK